MVSGGSASPRVMPRRPGILASPCACRCNTWHVCTCVCVSVCVRAPARFCQSSCVQKQCLGIVLGRMRQRMNKRHRSALDPRLQNTAHMATPASAWKALWWQPIAKAFPLARTLSDIVQGRHHTAPTPPDTTDPVRARLEKAPQPRVAFPAKLPSWRGQLWRRGFWARSLQGSAANALRS